MVWLCGEDKKGLKISIPKQHGTRRDLYFVSKVALKTDFCDKAPFFGFAPKVTLRSDFRVKIITLESYI